MAARRGNHKPSLRSELVARGTYRPDRDPGLVEVVEPDSLPQRPDWLTSEGEEVWIDDVARVSAYRLVTERDATVFGQYCNLMGGCIKVWRSGNVPPIAAISEARKMAELFG